VGRSRTFARGAAALTVLGATAGSILLVGSVGRGRVTEELQAAVDGRSKQLRQALVETLAGVELQAQTAASNPRLVAALSGRVSQDTLRDLFRTESWWQPVRESFGYAYVASPGQASVLISGKKDLGVDTTALIGQALETRRPASAVLAADGWPHALVAVPVVLPNPAHTPVLVLADPIEAAFVNKLAERVGAAVVVSDGARALLGAGQSLETTHLRQAIGQETARGHVQMQGDRAPAVAVAQVGPRLWLLGFVDVGPTVARAGAAYAAVRVAVGAVGGAAFLLLLWWSWRGSHPALAAPPVLEMTSFPAEGSTAGRYVLINRLGGGGMAEVHLALAVGERGFRRPCVVKRLRPELVANPAAVAQFTDEATLASSLVHANIVPIFDFTKVGNDYLLVEEYIVGRDLGRLVRRAITQGKRLPPSVVAYMGVEALKALDYAHAKRDHDGLPLGIVHRDVSPENIMITIRGEVQLLDFGVMKLAQARGGRTEIGELKGNLSFMAPEQARGLDVDARADLFALAAVLYFAIAGEPLYGKDTGYDLLVKAASGPSQDESGKIAALPAPFDRVLGKALSPRREERYPHALAFAEALGSLAATSNPGAIGALVVELFGEELNQEQQQLSATSTSIRLAAGLPPPAPPSSIQGDLRR
jgi:hypothetical protein